MINKFPEFQILHINHHEELLHLYEHYEPYSDFNFISLFSWNIDDKAEISLLNDNLVIRLKDYTQDGYFFTFIGDIAVLDTINTLLAYLETIKQGPVLKLIPEFILESLLHQTESLPFKIEEDRDQFDYIYSVDKLIHLKSGEFKKKRNLITNLRKRMNDQQRIQTIDINDAEVFKSIMDLTKEWISYKIRKNKSVNDDEIKGLIRVKTFANYSKLLNIGIYDGAKLIAFSINEIIHKNYAITHFEKSNPNYTGAGELLLHSTALELKDKRVEYLNFEQDLGEANLRTAKNLWRPIKFLKKYTITRK